MQAIREQPRDESRDDARRRRSRRWRWLLIVTGLLIALLMLLPLVAGKLARQWLTNAWAQRHDAPCTIESLDLGYSGFRIRGVEIRNPPGFDTTRPRLSLERAAGSFSEITFGASFPAPRRIHPPPSRTDESTSAPPTASCTAWISPMAPSSGASTPRPEVIHIAVAHPFQFEAQRLQARTNDIQATIVMSAIPRLRPRTFGGGTCRVVPFAS